MKVGRSEVQSWLDAVAPGTGFVRLAQLSGLPRLRVTQQVSRGSVAAATIAAIARGLDLDPLTELARFHEFADVVPATPFDDEIVAFIPTAGLLQAAVHRLKSVTTDESELGDETYDHLALNWFVLADDGNLRAHLQQELGIAQPTLWKMLRTRLREDVAFQIAQYAQFPSVSALVISGVLTGAEAGWEPECRSRWVNAVPLGQLLAVTEKRLHEVGKQVRNLETFENHLG
ncbi:hypothetical protein [Glutamicibacter ardleyensis]|uniref:hypothetical protein n=1 Tax=Glutamicibacter ardleyensis TaxID=225894 RepID=UPI003FD63CC4